MSPATRARKVARVHQLAAQGDTNRVIAKKVGVSEATVRRYRRISRAENDAPGDAPACDKTAAGDAADCVTGASSDAPACVTPASSPASGSDLLTVSPDAAGDAPERDTRATADAADCVTGASPGASSDAPGRVTAAPSPASSPASDLTVPLDAAMRARLGVLAEAGFDPVAALRLSLQLLADSLARRWGQGVIPRGEIPPMRIEFKTLAQPPQMPPIRHRRDETITP